MKRMHILIAAAVLVVAAGLVASPPAQAKMLVGNYDVLTNRYERASWVWFISNCQPPDDTCLDISAIPRLKFYAYYDGDAHLADGRYTLTVDVPDGLQCLPGYAMPTHETWTWDEVSLAGTIDSRYDVGCFNGPPGSQFWTFSLQRL
ncbi:hypothetical protein [Mycobacterium sp. IDR2000157661]|uniref:hypothetical protein n=1 Tax=Mycobacterium sp. IDR2000157661 TaxID=2867005 RepID=UPI001EE9B455|nr:hypothetical protein [Mycobacterium sp. IDR2000157661]ULE31770.1 hypothetical protein K3G64_16425 [Mycobacterium sp. IDR2000157661]